MRDKEGQASWVHVGNTHAHTHEMRLEMGGCLGRCLMRALSTVCHNHNPTKMVPGECACHECHVMTVCDGMGNGALYVALMCLRVCVCVCVYNGVPHEALPAAHRVCLLCLSTCVCVCTSGRTYPLLIMCMREIETQVMMR